MHPSTSSFFTGTGYTFTELLSKERRSLNSATKPTNSVRGCGNSDSAGTVKRNAICAGSLRLHVSDVALITTEINTGSVRLDETPTSGPSATEKIAGSRDRTRTEQLDVGPEQMLGTTSDETFGGTNIKWRARVTLSTALDDKALTGTVTSILPDNDVGPVRSPQLALS